MMRKDDSAKRFTALLTEETEAIASATHAFHFGMWETWSHSGSSEYTALVAEMTDDKRPTGKRLISVLR